MFKEYFKELEEESIRDNFVIVYELMDEVMDFGFPQTTDSKILQEWVEDSVTVSQDYSLAWKACHFRLQHRGNAKTDYHPTDYHIAE